MREDRGLSSSLLTAMTRVNPLVERAIRPLGPRVCVCRFGIWDDCQGMLGNRYGIFALVLIDTISIIGTIILGMQTRPLIEEIPLWAIIQTLG